MSSISPMGNRQRQPATGRVSSLQSALSPTIKGTNSTPGTNSTGTTVPAGQAL